MARPPGASCCSMRSAAARAVRAGNAPAGRRARPAGRERLVAARRAQSPRGMEETTRGGVMRSWLALVGAVGLAAAGWGKRAPPPEEAATGGGAAATPPGQEPPGPVKPDPPLHEPPPPYDHKIEGGGVGRPF